MRKRPNGTGTIRYYKGRPKPYAAFGPAKAVLIDGKLKMIQPYIGSFKTYKEADLALSAYKLNPKDLNIQRKKFGEYLDLVVEQRRENMKPQSFPPVKHARKKAEPIAHIKAKDLTLEHLQLVIDDCESVTSKNNTILLFKGTFDYIRSLDDTFVDLTKNLKMYKVEKKTSKSAFSRDEIQLIRDNIDFTLSFSRDSKYKPKFKDLKLMDTVLILIYTGCRITELLTVKSEDIDLQKRIMKVGGTKTENAERLVPIHKDIMPYISKRACNEYLVCDNDSAPIIYEQYRRVFFGPMCKHFGLDHTVHETRHTFATYSALANMNPVLRKKMFGHSDKDLTDGVYTHVFAEDLVAEIDKMAI